MKASQPIFSSIVFTSPSLLWFPWGRLFTSCLSWQKSPHSTITSCVSQPIWSSPQSFKLLLSASAIFNSMILDLITISVQHWSPRKGKTKTFQTWSVEVNSLLLSLITTRTPMVRKRWKPWFWDPDVADIWRGSVKMMQCIILINEI